MAGGSELIVKITGKDVGLKSVLNDAGDDVGRFGDRIGRLGGHVADFAKTAAVGLGAAAVGVGVFLKKSVEAAEESRKVMAQTNAVIESTGGVANVTAAHVGKYADQLAALTGIDDEVIASGQNMLLTFTNVRNEVGKGNDIFDQGTKAALNMSVALGTDMKSASMLVGKALNDPIAGMTALTRSGIQFTTQQKDQIKAMVAAGDTLGAQKIILKELETQFGKSAEAAASPMARLKVVVGNLQEELGARLLPVVGQVASFLADKLPGAIDRVTGLFSGLFNVFVNRDFTGEFGKALGVEEDSPIVAKVFAFRDTVVGAFERIVGWVRENWPQIKETVTQVLDTVHAVVSGFVDVVSTLWANFGEQITDYVRNSWNAAREIIGGALEVIQGLVATITAIIHGDWSAAWDGIKQVLAGAWDVMVGLTHQWTNVLNTIVSVAMEILGSVVRAAFEGIVNFISSIPGRILDALGNLDDLLWDAGMAVMRGFLNGLKAGFEAVKNFVGGVASWIASHKGPIQEDRRLLVPAGQAIMDGLVRGLQSHESRLLGQLGQMTGYISGVGSGTVTPGLGTAGSGSSAATAAADADYERLAAAIASALVRAGVGMANGEAPMHIAREIAWAQGA